MRETGWRRGLRAAWRPGQAPLVDADVVLGGRADAAALLGLRIVRTSSWLVLAIGLIIAWSTGQAARVAELNTARGLVEAMRTPLVVVASGVLLRFLLTPAAWTLALAALWRARDETRLPAGAGLSWTDLWRTADGWRALRWTLDVRHRAASRLGTPGRLLVLTELAARTATGLAFTLLVVLVGR